ncbi:carbon storage regulator, CsrA [Selenomonas sp. WCT3]|uniref:carbon storage regulator n=1 Tax=Selenomonas sp. WCT3 TaxID=3158785 RepID=UPI00088E33AC|nr:carbon storage regulator, CsrA [Selenomonas ruminantium]
MLVLSRKEQQEIMIGEKVIVTVVKVAAGKIKLGITAPNSVKVRRLDVLQAGTMENGEDSHEI